jgi:hypothetical protein
MEHGHSGTVAGHASEVELGEPITSRNPADPAGSEGTDATADAGSLEQSQHGAMNGSEVVDEGLPHAEDQSINGSPKEDVSSQNHSSLPQPPTVGAAQTQEDVEGSQKGQHHEKAPVMQVKAGSDALPGTNALLNLPPPLPFDLAVTDLWVGVPHRATPSWVNLPCLCSMLKF